MRVLQEFIPFETDLTLTREQLSSGGQDALFRKTGNFVGTSDMLIETTTVSIGETELQAEWFNHLTLDLSSTQLQILFRFMKIVLHQNCDEALINDGRTDKGQNVEFNISIDGFSSVNSSDAVGVIIWLCYC